MCVTPEGRDGRFRCNVYQLLDDPNGLTLVHYIGDHTIAAAFRHGNAKGSSQTFTRTCPSVLRNVEDLSDLPSNIYKREVGKSDCLSEHQPVLVPRNSKQVDNMQLQTHQKFCLTHDALYNMHELAYDLGGFV